MQAASFIIIIYSQYKQVKSISRFIILNGSKFFHTHFHYLNLYIFLLLTSAVLEHSFHGTLPV